MSSEVKSLWVGDVFREFVDGVLRREFPKSNGLARSWHQNGQLESEGTLINGMMDGVVREWHPNGVLKKEETRLRGTLHGLVRKWSSKGELLGSYEMIDGRGTMFNWREDGSVETKIEVYGGGCMHSTDYAFCDEEALETFLWNGKPVGRKKFMDCLRRFRQESL